jgi:hypothetical protein
LNRLRFWFNLVIGLDFLECDLTFTSRVVISYTSHEGEGLKNIPHSGGECCGNIFDVASEIRRLDSTNRLPSILTQVARSWSFISWLHDGWPSREVDANVVREVCRKTLLLAESSSSFFWEHCLAKRRGADITRLFHGSCHRRRRNDRQASFCRCWRRRLDGRSLLSLSRVLFPNLFWADVHRCFGVAGSLFKKRGIDFSLWLVEPLHPALTGQWIYRWGFSVRSIEAKIYFSVIYKENTYD